MAFWCAACRGILVCKLNIQMYKWEARVRVVGR